ncbi:MAG: hypothetical protein ACUVWR_18220 [Anaerolineae bacterium]
MSTVDQIDLNSIEDVEQARHAIAMLFNLIEDLQATIRQLQAENQRLHDENNRLKGEQGRPEIKSNRHGQVGASSGDHSSEGDRRKPQTWHEGSKLTKVKIDREEVLRVEPSRLPADAQFKGYEDIVVQDVLIRTDNVLYHKEKYYSPGEQRTYEAELPPGYSGQFGPGIKALATVNRHLAALKSCCRFARSRGLLSLDPSRGR